VSLPARFKRSTLIVLDHLANTGPMYPNEIIEKSGLSPRSVTYALRELLKFKLCRKLPNLSDMRKPLYKVDQDRIREIERQIEVARAQVHGWIR